MMLNNRKIEQVVTQRPFGLLFDLDGVLIDSHDDHWKAWHQFFAERDISISLKDFSRSFGQRNEDILKGYFPDATPEERQGYADRKEELFRAFASGNVVLLEGVEGFLKEVRSARIPRIIASSAPIANLHFFLKETPLSEYFESFVSAEEVAQGKPAPDLFIEAARRLRLPVQECIVFEDSLAGLAAGRASGAFVVALATTHPAEQLLHYDLLIRSPRELSLKALFAARYGTILDLVE